MRGRAPFAMKGAAMSSSGAKVSFASEPRVALVEDPVVLLVRARRVVAQALDGVGDRRPRAVQVDALLRQHGLRVHDHAHLAVRVGVPDHVGLAREPRVAKRLHHGRAVGLPHLQDRAQLLVEEHGEDAVGKVARQHVRLALVAVHVELLRVEREVVEDDRHAGAAREGHLAEGREEAAVGAVVVGEDPPRRVQRLDGAEEGGELRRVVHVRRDVPDLAVHLRERGAAQPVAAAAEIDEDEFRLAERPCAAAA